MQDCFLSYKCNEMRIRVEWRMAEVPAYQLNFIVCMMAVRQAIDNLSGDTLVWQAFSEDKLLYIERVV